MKNYVVAVLKTAYDEMKIGDLDNVQRRAITKDLQYGGKAMTYCMESTQNNKCEDLDGMVVLTLKTFDHDINQLISSKEADQFRFYTFTTE